MIFAFPFAAVAFGLIGFMLLSQPLMADCMDYDEVLTGKRRETTYSGMNALITKPAVSIGKAAFLFIIAFYGYKEGVANPLDQPTSVATGVILAFALIPIICLTIGMIVLHWFPLDGPEWKAQKVKLHEIHVEKEMRYLEKLKSEEKLQSEIES